MTIPLKKIDTFTETTLIPPGDDDIGSSPGGIFNAIVQRNDSMRNMKRELKNTEESWRKELIQFEENHDRISEKKNSVNVKIGPIFEKLGKSSQVLDQSIEFDKALPQVDFSQFCIDFLELFGIERLSSFTEITFTEKMR